MKLQHLRFLVATVECGGVVKAAVRLHVSQPAVSAGLKSLEQETGQPLFERSGRGGRARPTSKALQLHQHAIGILQQCDLALSQLRSPERRPATLHMGVLPTIAAREIVGLSAAFSGQAGCPRIQLREGGMTRLADWLRQGRIDAALTVVENDASTARRLWRERYVVVVSRSHRFAQNRRSKVFLSDLEEEPVVLRTTCEMRRGSLWPDTRRIRVAARIERDELTMLLVAQGLGIAIVPESLVSREVVARPIHDLDVQRSIGLRWRKDLSQEHVTALVEAISALKGGRKIRDA